MNHLENLTRYTANFVDELISNGLRHVVISPGSRSTPLAVLFTAHKDVKEWVLVDERSAAFFALGIARETNTPVALVCTSGTAAANYYPAIIEAYYARIPLLVLTSDRPHELRGVGAAQAMDQLGMYGDFVKLFYEMAPPSAKKAMLNYVRNRASRAMQTAIMGNPGPVHLNFPYQEPLMPQLSLNNLWGNRAGAKYNEAYIGKNQLTDEQVNVLVDKLSGKMNGLLVCGPQTDRTLANAIVKLSKKLRIPILADPLSQLRTGLHTKETVITTYDTILKTEEMRQILQPDYIIRFGAMPISKQYLFYVGEHADAFQVVVENNDTVREPTNQQTEYVIADSTQFCFDLAEKLTEKLTTNDWLERWQHMQNIVLEQLNDEKSDVILEGLAVRDLFANLDDQDSVFIANSMPVRDADTFLPPLDKEITVQANRGLSGIDGTMSSALGVAAATNKKVYLIIGDLSFYHDLNSLQIAKQYELNVTVLLINNNGGGIFSFLPQAEDPTYFEHLFGTPLDLDFHHVVKMFGGEYRLVKEQEAFNKALNQLDSSGSNLSVLEIQTNRDDNVKWHRHIWKNISQRLYEYAKTFSNK